MFKLPILALAAAASLSLAGCTDGYGYSGVSVGYGGYGGYGGYADPYGYDNIGAFGSPYWGWYGDYYYPGTGYYVYDRDRRPYRWNSGQRSYWEGRRRNWRGDRGTFRPNWGDYDRRGGGVGRPAWQNGSRGEGLGRPDWRGDRRGPRRSDGNPGYVRLTPPDGSVVRPDRPRGTDGRGVGRRGGTDGGFNRGYNRPGRGDRGVNRGYSRPGRGDGAVGRGYSRPDRGSGGGRGYGRRPRSE